MAYDEAHDNPQAYQTDGGSINAIYDFGGVSRTSITAYETTSGYSRGDTDGGAAANAPVNGVPNGFGQSMGRNRDLDQYTQELRLVSEGDDALQWQVGAFYFDAPRHHRFLSACVFPADRRAQSEQLGAPAQHRYLVGRLRAVQL